MHTNETPVIAISELFFDSFAKNVDSKDRRNVQHFLMRFQSEAASESLGLSDVPNAAQSDFKAKIVEDKYSIIISQQGSVFLLLWIDLTEKASVWASTHVCKINPVTGTMQVYELVAKTEQESVKETSSQGVLAAFSDEQLLQLGVPADTLAQIKQLSDRKALESFRSHIPPEVFECLVSLADGESYDEVQKLFSNTPNASNPIESLKGSGSQRNFKVVETDEEMMHIVDASLERWRVFLHPTQYRLVNRKETTPMVIKGAAGTGKTVVAMHRAVNLVRRKDWDAKKKLLFTTFTKNLATDISLQLDSLCSAEEKRRIEVTNIDSWVASFLKHNQVTKAIAYPGQQRYEDCWKDSILLIDAKSELDEEFFREEWERVVLAQNVTTEKEYLSVMRKGRGKPISRRQRKAAWPVFEEMRNLMLGKNIMSIEDACFLALRILKSKKGLSPYQAVIVDEAQDLGNEALTLLAYLALPEGDETQSPNILVVGDGLQRIYPRQGSLSSCNIVAKGRNSVRLKLSYRTTEEIREVANTVLMGAEFNDIEGGKESTKGGLSNRNGVRPEKFVAQTIEEECHWIADKIKELEQSDSKFKRKDICIVTRTNNDLEHYQKLLTQAGINTVKVARKSFDDRSEDGVRLATMHRVKGLEYRAVFIVGANAGKLPSKYRTSDEEEIRNHNLIERSLFYVSATRARDVLFISCFGTASEFIRSIP